MDIDKEQLEAAGIKAGQSISIDGQESRDLKISRILELKIQIECAKNHIMSLEAHISKLKRLTDREAPIFITFNNESISISGKYKKPVIVGLIHISNEIHQQMNELNTELNELLK
jgi:hypothetical protein